MIFPLDQIEHLHTCNVMHYHESICDSWRCQMFSRLDPSIELREAYQLDQANGFLVTSLSLRESSFARS